MCHPQQYQDWQSALHSKSMGPGIAGQLAEMVHDDPNNAELCWSCHAPLAEQKDKIFEPLKGWLDNPEFDPALQTHGVTCAACHVRQYQQYGPPRRGSPEITGKIDAGLPHGGFIAATAFTRSEFCKGCHQFNADDFSLNGKLIENTYEEWRASRYAADGVQCQDCHMPARRHLWRGIHDKEMVKSAVSINVELPDQAYAAGDRIEAIITVTNSGTGHYFPTYLTPKVFVIGRLIGKNDRVLEASRQEYVIGRESFDLTSEAYDTRIPPGQQSRIEYNYAAPDQGLQLQIQVIVDPDHWYRRFYRNYLDNGWGGSGRELLVEALKNSEKSAFIIYEKTYPLN